MRLQKYLQEKFYGYEKFSKFPIYVNPTPKDLKQIYRESGKEVRIIADNKKKNLYVADAKSLLHYNMWDNIEDIDQKLSDPSLFLGMGETDGRNLFLIGSDETVHYVGDSGTTEEIKKIRNKFKWMEKYVEFDYPMYLREEFVGYVSRVSPLYKNPTKKELDQLRKERDTNEVRFIADSRTKNLYVMDAKSIIHVGMWRAIAKETNDRRGFADSTLLNGNAVFKNGEWITYRSDNLIGKEKKILKKLYKQFKWINVIDIDTYFDKKIKEKK